MPVWLWAAVLGPRLAFFVLAAADAQRCLRGDSLGYLALARNLVEHGNFSSASGPPFLPETFRTPGYPLFLAGFQAVGSPVLAAALAQCLLGGATVWLAWRWFERIGGRRGAAVGAAVMALDPVTLFHTPLILTETLFTLFLILAAGLTWEWTGGSDRLEGSAPAPPRPFLCGLLWSLSTLVRPVSLYLPVLLCGIWLRNRKAFLVFLAGAYLLPAAWTLRNWSATGHILFFSGQGIYLLRYPAAGIEALRTGRPWSELDLEMTASVDAEHPRGYASDAEQGEAYRRAAMPVLKAHPVLLARFCLAGSLKTLAGTGWEMLLEWTGLGRRDPAAGAFNPGVTGAGTLGLLRRNPWLIPLQLLYMAALLVFYALNLAGLWNLWRQGRRLEAIFLGGCAAYFLAMASSQGYYRYRLPMMPFLAAGAAAAFAARRG